MTGPFVGALLGGACAGGALCVVAFASARRRPSLEARVAPYVATPRIAPAGSESGLVPWSGLAAVAMPSVRRAGRRLDGVLGGTASLRRRLEQAGAETTVEQLRVEQLAWGAGAFGVVFVAVLLCLAGGAGISAVAAALLCLSAFVSGVLAREQALSRRVRVRTERIESEFPTVAELFALAVAAGEGAHGATSRVTRACSGELARELGVVLDDTRGGRGFAAALRAMADRLAVPSVTRFVEGLVIAVERGTPLADVVRAQAADARDARRRELMETAGRREIAMLVPVVFLVLPVTVVFALFPGFYGLSLSAP